MTQPTVAFVIKQTDKDYTIITDTASHTLSLPINFDSFQLDNGTWLKIQDFVFNPHKLYTACKEYNHNIQRKKLQYRRRVERKKQEEKSPSQ